MFAIMPCPNSSIGYAYWFCDTRGNWANPSPDLSQCTSMWLNEIIFKLDEREQKESIVHLSSSLVQKATANTYHGGDISKLIYTIEKMTDKMRLDLELIPTSSQRKAVITEVVQNIVKIGSAMISLRNLDTWRDVGAADKELSAISSYVTSLENAGLLLPEGAGENKEVTIASDNICKYFTFTYAIVYL